MSQRLHTYAEFYRAYVLRKRQDLVAPRLHPIADIALPRNSLIHYMPKNNQDNGPGYPEAFISNWPGEIYIDFQFGFTPVIGAGHTIAFNAMPIIKFYRNQHYEYKWAREMRTFYRNDRKLIVQNHALADRNWYYTANLFINFSRAYNAWHMLMTRINDVAANYPTRQQFVRIDLPVNMPGFKLLMEDTLRYVKRFEDGKPKVDNTVIRATKAENCYWLMDLLLWLRGQNEYSLFGKIDKKAYSNLHFLICSNSRTWVINVGLLMSWFEPLQVKEDKIMLPVKRFYLNLIKMVNGSTDDALSEQSNEEPSSGELAGGTGTTTDDSAGKNSTRPGVNRASETSADAVAETPAGDVDLVDIFKRAKTPPAESPTTATSQGSGDDAGRATPVPGTTDGANVATPTGSDDPTYGAGVDSESDGSAGDGKELDWLSPIDDLLLEPAVLSEAISVVKDVFEKPESGINLALEEMAKDGTLTVKQKRFYEEKALSYKTITMPNGQSMEDFIKIDPKELKDIGGHIQGNFPTVRDQTMLRQRVVALRNDYPKKFMHKDIAAAVLNLQNAGLIIADYQIEEIEDIEGSNQVIKFQVMPVKGKAGTRVFRFPTVDEHGHMFVDGVKQYYQFQRVEKPIRKIDERRVVLTSLYDKKVNITRSEMVVDDYGRWLIRQIMLNAAERKLVISNANLIDRSVKCPRYVTMLNRKFKIIRVVDDPGNLEFNFDTEALLATNPDWKKHCTKDTWVVGTFRNKPITIDSFGIVTVIGGAVLGSFEELVGVNMRKSPIEHAVINVNGYLFPVGVVLCYYFGVDKLLKVLRSEYRSIPAGQRYKLAPDEYALTFNDEQLVFNKRDRLTALVFGGMVKLSNMSNFSRADLNNRGVWVPLMGDPKVRAQHFQEMKNMFDLFIDPITKDRLKVMGYSVDFHYLIIDAVKMLRNDFTRHEVELEEQNVTCYERFVSHIYSELCKSNRQYKSKPDTGNQTFDLNPEAIITNIITDSAAGLVKEMTPFHEVKSQEDVTFGGFKGRDEQTMLKRTRSQLKSYKGVMSEANKDNGKVGFVGYLTSDPRIEDFRGGIDTKESSTGSQLFSSIGNLKYGTTLDDESFKIR